MDSKDYMPIVAGASPDNPVPTKQYESEEAVHPNRDDIKKPKIANAVQWIIRKNNSIRFPAFIWLVIFFFWWFAMILNTFWLPASLSAIYEQQHFTFSVDLVSQLINIYGFMTVIVFPAYVVCYGILAAAESLLRWKERRTAMDIQAKNL